MGGHPFRNVSLHMDDSYLDSGFTSEFFVKIEVIDLR